ncbi:MAG: hypothetical protein RLZZ453_42 [Chlamydiota bacterium]|jgi:integrase
MATIQKRKNKNGTTSYRVMIRPDDGLPIQYKTFPTNQEAKDWAIQEEAKRRQGLYFPEKSKQKHTLAELIDRYIQDILPSIKSAEDALRHLNWWKLKLGKFALNHVSSDLISKHRRELLDEILTKGKKRTEATVNRYLASLSAVLSHGVKECEWISSNPMSRVKKLKEAEGRSRTLSSDECSRLLDACAKSSNSLLLPFVILALTTGARSGELLSLKWNAVDLENGVIHLKSTKNGRPRVLAIVGDVLDVLKNLYAKRNPEKPLVFASKTRFGQLTLRKPWEKALKEARIEDFRVHDLRHCFATIASVSGTSNIQLSAATGHRTLSQLLRYCHPDTASVQQLTTKVYEKLVNTTNLSEIIASDQSTGTGDGSD